MKLIPIRDRLGTIIGLQQKEDVDAVQATIDASMKTLGAPTPPAQVQTPVRPALRFQLSVLVIVIIVVAVWLGIGQPHPTQRIPLPPTSIAALTPSSFPRPTETAMPTPQSIEEPAQLPTMLPTEAAFAPPPAPPVQEFCADRASQWGNTHQCSTSQATADALADGEIGRINATAEAIQKQQ